MLRITRQTDFAILLLTYMASTQDGEPGADGPSHSTRELAEWSGLSVPMVSKVLKPLARAGIVDSTRGARGGYRIARSSRSISVAEVIRALEGPIGMTACVLAPGTCEQEPVCPTKVNWEKISDAVQRALDGIPLSDMVGRVPERLVPLAEPPIGRERRPGRGSELVSIG